MSVPLLHDKSKVSPMAFSIYSKPVDDDKSPCRARIKQGASSFHDLRGLSHVEAVDVIRQRDVHVLVDMAGFTQDGRPEIFALEPAPVTIGFLGFASTSASDYMDYMAADSTAAPPELASTFSERLLLLPPSYYVTDHSNLWKHLAPTSAVPAVNKVQLGIQEHCRGKFLFSTFNQPFKIHPTLWSVWMRIMKRVPNSCLWILKLNEGIAAQPNLMREAEKQGVDPDRLYFTGSADADVHVTYKSVAELMLDADLYNAHSTAADTLWAGVPLITLSGTRMASRIAGSLVKGADAEWMIARTFDEYEELAVRFALSETTRASLRDRLVTSRTSLPLFNTALWVRRWEAGLRMVWDIAEAQLDPIHVIVSEQAWASNDVQDTHETTQDKRKEEDRTRAKLDQRDKKKTHSGSSQVKSEPASKDNHDTAETKQPTMQHKEMQETTEKEEEREAVVEQHGKEGEEEGSSLDLSAELRRLRRRARKAGITDKAIAKALRDFVDEVTGSKA
mmetsp:Transcript_38038/g.82410  ORF Transcript_38038/g.82410 Transcript_38038/m.82410 type:complete len:505 (-) Transcript_38038:40-1554(-)